MFTPRLFKIKRHSRRVLVFKRPLPVFAFILASLMLVWPILIAEQKEQFSVAVKTDKKNTSAKVDMEQVRFYAQDKKKQNPSMYLNILKNIIDKKKKRRHN